MNDRIRAMQADAILRQDEERQRLEAERQRVRVNLSGRAVSPAAAAAADQARRRLGLPAGPVPDPIVEQEASIESTMQALSDHHKSIRWLSSPPNAAVASDRVEELTAMEKASNLMRWNSQQAWNLPGRFIGAGVADYLGMGLEGVGIAAERVTDRAGASATGEVGTWQWATGLNALNMAGGFLRDVGEANRNAASYFRGEENSEQYLRAGRPDLVNRIDKPEGVAGFALDVAGGLGQVGGAIATAPISMPLLFGSGVSQANDSVEEAQKREGREGQYSAGDDTALLAGGLVTGLSERLGINAIMGRLPKPIQDRIKGRIGQFLVAGATEGATEVAEGVGQNAISAALGNDQSILDGSLVYQGGVGAVVGSVANALIQTAIPGRQNQIDAGRAAEAAQKSAAFQQMVEASTNSELRQRSPERYESFLSDVTDGAEVFIPAEKVAEFFQSNADMDQWMDEWNIRDQVQEALVAGTDVVMPMSTYLARVAPTEAHSAWVNDVRFGMGAMSANEASEFAKNNAESLAASIDLAIDSALSASPAIDAAMRVYDDVRRQLREAGYTVDAADTQARMVATTASVLSERNPEVFADPWAAYQDNGLQVRQEFPDIVRQNMDRVDVMLEALRRGRAQPSQGRVFGRSMMEFLSSRGGVQDSGGELAAMNIEAWHRPKEGGKAFRSRFTRQGDVREGAFEFDGATQAAIEAGYLPEGSTQTELLAAIREELAGRPTFSQQVETDQGAVENAAALDQLERLIGDMGLELGADKSANAAIKAALDRAADSGDVAPEGAATFDQAPADINSPEFKAWFGDSKVVDEQGNPLVVYHGTNAEFDAFDLSQAGQTDAGLVGAGVYLSPDARLAEGYGETVIGAYVSVTNPYVITDGNLPDGRSLIDAHGGALTDASAGALNDEIKSLGHDGVIFTMDGEISQVVAFDPTQIKSVNNRGTFDGSNPNIYYQGGDGAGIERPLYVTHNLSADNLRHAVELGGLAAPSLAVARGDIGFDGFGEISLVGRPDMADPKGRGVRAFEADVYSPRQPRAQFKVPAAPMRALNDAMREVADRLGLSATLTAQDIERQGVAALEADSVLKAAWLESMGEEVPVIMTQARDAPAPIAGFDGIDGASFREVFFHDDFKSSAVALWNARIEAVQANTADAATIREYYFEADGTPKEAMLEREARKVATRNATIASAMRETEAPTVDQYATSRAIEGAVGNRADMYGAWLRLNFGDVVGDAFFESRSGAKRAYTLTNLVREMTQSLRGGEGFSYGAGNVRAAVAREFDGLADVQGARGRIVPVGDMAAVKDEVNAELFRVIDLIRPSLRNGDRFGAADEAIAFLTDLAKGDIRQWQSEWFETPLTDDVIGEASAFLEKLRDLPTEYFEIKMQRAVGLGEFSAAVIPSDASEVTRKALTDAGLELVEYDRSEEGARQQAVASIGDRVFFQRPDPEAAPRGQVQFTDGGALIRLFAGRDPTTFTHEMGHVWLEQMRRLARNAKSSSRTKADFQIVLDWFASIDHSEAHGQIVKNRDAAKRAAEKPYSKSDPDQVADHEAAVRSLADHEAALAWLEERGGVDAMAGVAVAFWDDAPIAIQGVLKTPYHEYWARGIERYMMEGKSPSVGMRDVLRSVMAWMKSIYRTVDNLKAPISDEVRGVMDRLFATDAEIDAARDATGQALGVEAFAELGATEAEQAAYARNVERTRSDAEDELLGRVMRAVRRERNKEWREAADAMREEVAAQVDMDADLTALDVIKNHGAMDREAVVAIMGDAAGLALLPKRIPPIYSANGGQHPDMVAEVSGYRTGMEMLNALMDYQVEHENNKDAGWKKGVRAKRIEDRIREALLDRYGDILNDGSIEQEALDAIHSERYAELLGVDLQVLGRRIGQAPAPIDAIRQWARDRIGGRTVREIRPANYLRAERKASNDTQRALASNDREAAFRHKQAQAINNALYMASSKAKRETDAVVRRLRKLGSKRSPGIHVDYMEQIDAILEQFELRRVSGVVVQRRQSLAAFIAQMEAEGRPVNIPEKTLDALSKQNIEDLTVDEIMALGDAVKNIEALGRLKSELILKGERRRIQELKDEAFDRTSSLPNRKAPTLAGDQGRIEKAERFFLGAAASLRRMSEIARRLDNSDTEGPFNEVYVRGAHEAAASKAEYEKRFWEPIVDASKLIPKDVSGRYLDVITDHPFVNTKTGEKITLRRGDLLVVGLNVGNVSNFEVLAKGWGFLSMDADPVQVSSARNVFVTWLDKYLHSTEWDFIQAHWDGHAALWDDYSNVARRLEGISPVPVEIQPVVLADRTLNGGYAPIIYHPDFDDATFEREAKEQSDILGSVMKSGPRPDNGSTNTRSGYIGPIDMRMDRQKNVIDKHITYASYGIYIDSALRFTNDKDIRTLVTAKLGEDIYKTFVPYLEGQVRGNPPFDPNAVWYNQVARYSRSAVVSASLLGSATVLLSQIGGLPITASKIGLPKLAMGMKRIAQLHGLWGEGARDYVTDKSAFMLDRLKGGEIDRDIKFTIERGHADNVVIDKLKTGAGRAIAEVDFWLVSGPTWLGVYEAEINNGATEADAIFEADHMVSVTQGSGRASDQSGFMRGGDVVKMATIAFSWASAFENMASGAIFDIRHGRNIGRNSMMLASMAIIVPLADALVSGDWPDWEDEDGPWAAAAKWVARNVFFNLFVGVPVVRDFASYYERKAQGEYASAVGGTPYARLAGEVTRLVKDVEDALNEDKELSHRWPAHIVSAVGTLRGIPYTSQVTRSLNYGLDVREGDQNPENALDVATGVVRGPQKDQK